MQPISIPPFWNQRTGDGAMHYCLSPMSWNKFSFTHLFLTIAFPLFFNSYLAGQYSSFYTGRHTQYQFDSLPHFENKFQLKTNLYPPIPEYKYYNPTYLKNKVLSVTKTSTDNNLVQYQKYNREGYLIEEIQHLDAIPDFPDNRGHHYYRYANQYRLVLDSLIPDTSNVAIKHQYLFNADFHVVSHRIISNNYLLPDSTTYAYDSSGNCIRVISFYKHYRIEPYTGTVQFLKNGEAFSMRSDTVQFIYQYLNNQTLKLVRKDNSYQYGSSFSQITIKSKIRRIGYWETQTFDSLSRIIMIQSSRSTVEFFYHKDAITMEVYNTTSGKDECTFYYDKYGHLKKMCYFLLPMSTSNPNPKKYCKKVHYRKNGLLVNNEFGGRMIYEYYKN